MSAAFSIRAAARHLPVSTLVLLTSAAVAADVARMRLPEAFEPTAVRHAIDGFGGRNRGEFRLGGNSGSFTRIESRLAIFDPALELNRGRSSFTLAGPDFDGTLSGECAFKENVVTIGIVTFDPKKLAYVCSLTSSDGTFDGTLTLGEPRPRSMRERVLAQAIRVGEAEVGPVRIAIESVHNYAGSRFASATPVGYVLSIDDVVAAAVELTDVNPTVILAPDVDATDRQALTAAALAVAVLRDPADSMLGDDD